jgi:uncharacterized protein YecE (DUF72 family)
LEGRTLRHALEVRHASFDCEEFVALARDREVAVVEAGDSDYPASRRAPPFQLLARDGHEASAPKGYAPAALARWRERAQTLAATETCSSTSSAAQGAQSAGGARAARGSIEGARHITQNR